MHAPLTLSSVRNCCRPENTEPAGLYSWPILPCFPHCWLCCPQSGEMTALMSQSSNFLHALSLNFSVLVATFVPEKRFVKTTTAGARNYETLTVFVS